MKMTNQQLINHINNFAAIMDVKLPARVSYAVNKNRKTLLSEYSTYSEEIEKLKSEYPEGGEAFEKEVAELLGLELEVPVYMAKSELLEGATQELSLNVFATLDFMLEDQEVAE